MSNESKNIGIQVNVPSKSCNDSKCAFHGDVKVRGRLFVGNVVSSAMQKTAIVEWPRISLVRKYERYLMKRSRVKAHNPDCINAKKGDKVKIGESRKLSKTKNFVILEVLPNTGAKKQAAKEFVKETRKQKKKQAKTNEQTNE